MPVEVVLVAMTALICGTGMIAFITKTVFDFLNGKRKNATDNSLTATQLESLIQSAVENATASLNERLHQLEEQMDEGAHLAAIDNRGLLEGMDGYVDHERVPQMRAQVQEG